MQQELEPARFLRRYKRFFADVLLESGEEVVAHCPNTGTMKTLLEEGAPAWVRHSDDPKRKLAYSLVLLGVPGGRALIDTALPNAIVAQAIAAGIVPSLTGYRSLRREVKVGERSRIDLVLEESEAGGPDCYIEVKNVTMLSATVAGRADFPDAVTERGRKHLGELMTLAEQGHRAVQLFFLGRTDCDRVGVAEEIDPAYAEALRTARARGVELLALRGNFEDASDGMVSMRVAGECSVDVDSRVV